jgi:hypothetical protein
MLKNIPENNLNRVMDEDAMPQLEVCKHAIAKESQT